MIGTRWTLMDEIAAAQWLRLTVKKLRDLRARGRGPQWFTLPTGEIRYTVEGLSSWAQLGCTTSLSVSDKSNLVAFPGVRIRTRLSEGSPGRGHSSGRRGWSDPA